MFARVFAVEVALFIPVVWIDVRLFAAVFAVDVALFIPVVVIDV